ncbi:class I SAM-dependent methyltransferase [Mesorhizobium newzealandense]|uniref:Class I SAM-dependent methyltransferase n=1 Tax=Mesorhizobium newzealandense TaxID=1300302 RepID=A0ABW4UNN0_9HYPH
MDPVFSAWFEGKYLSTDWTSRFLSVWASLLAARRDEPLKVLEIGSWEGRSAIFFLQYLSKCQLTCIDTFMGSPEHALRAKWADQLAHVEQRFDLNIAEFGGRVEKIKSRSSQALARLVAEDRSFDVVFIDGSHHSTDVLADAVFSWPMVRDGGIVIFDDYEWTFFADETDHPKLGVDTFLSVHAGQYRELYRGEQIIIQKIEASKIEPSRAPSPGAPAPLQEAGQARDIAEKSVEFVLIAEAGILDAQALLLCESIRCFTGAYSRCPITVVSPRSSRRPSLSTLRKLEQLDVEYLPIEIESYFPQYGTSYRIHALAHVERRPGPPIIVQLDSDTIFIAEPDFSLGASAAAARPVDVKGMCTTGSGDPFDSYWRKLCALVGVDYEHLPIVQTTVGGQAVRASYNGGLFVAKRACGLFQRTEDIFRQLVAADMKPWADGPTHNTGTGILHGEATSYWGTSQAAFSLAAVAGNHSVRLLPDTYNFPLNCMAALAVPDPARLVHIHYHHLFSAGSADANPVLNGTLDLPVGISEWLLARLPLQEHPQPTVPKRDLPKPPRRKAILVLGMHRSGTSALGGVINALGAAGPKNPLSPNSHNPRGFWESARLHLANEDLLASANSHWSDWQALDPRWMQSPTAERHRHKIRAILDNEFGDEPLFFVKDPRICRFVPFLSSILAEMAVDAVAFLPVRNPLEVALSLKRRDGLPLPRSLMLWLRHVLDAEYHSRGMPRYFLRHEDFLIDWRRLMDRAAEQTDVVWPARSSHSDVEIEQFLTADLHHERASIEDMRNHPDVTPLIRKTYDIFRAMAVDGESPELRAELDRVRMGFDESCDVLGMMVAAETEQLRGELGARNLEYGAAIRAQHDLRLEHDAVVRALHDVGLERDTVAGVLHDLRLERDAAVRAQHALGLERDTVARAIHDLGIERDELVRDRDALRAERNALLASSSWRLTAPLRWVKGPFVRRR